MFAQPKSPAALVDPVSRRTASIITAPSRSRIRGEDHALEAVRRAVGGRRRSPCSAQELVQNETYEVLPQLRARRSAEQADPAARPNGSAKSTFIRCLGRSLEHYSTLDEGALYRFSWIFPAQKSTRGGIGFGGGNPGARGDGVVRVSARRHDRRAARRRAPRSSAAADPARRAREAVHESSSASAPRMSRIICASARCRRATARSTTRCSRAIRGDIVQVLRHIRVERFEISHRYRQGWVTVEPQLSVDGDRAPDHRGSLAVGAAAVRCSPSRCTSTAARSSAPIAA